MSAAFCFKDHLCWGTNGNIENYLERMAEAAASSGVEPALADWLEERCLSFSMGTVVFLDDVFTQEERATRFVRLFNDATTALLNDGQYTEYGKQWLREEPPKLTACILAAFHASDS